MKTMKKILTVTLFLLVLMSMSLTTFAQVGGFVQSPSANQAPSLVGGSSDGQDCNDVLAIVGYGDRDQLNEELRAKLEEAYTDISGVRNLTALCGELKSLAYENGIPTTNLTVSDLFDIHDTEDVEGRGFDIVIKSETLENFVGLIHFTGEKWELIENARVEMKDGEYHLKFTTNGLSPFAIVVDSGETVPQENNDVLIGVLAIVAIAEAAALITILIKFILTKKTA